MPIIPLKIRKHLVPFFFQEFEGVEACYLNKRVKAAKINNKSSLGYLILNTLEVAEIPIKPDKYFIYLTYSDSEIDGKLYSNYRRKNNF